MGLSKTSIFIAAVLSLSIGAVLGTHREASAQLYSYPATWWQSFNATSAALFKPSTSSTTAISTATAAPRTTSAQPVLIATSLTQLPMTGISATTTLKNPSLLPAAPLPSRSIIRPHYLLPLPADALWPQPGAQVPSEQNVNPSLSVAPSSPTQPIYSALSR